MNIIILHHDLEPAENKLKEILELKGVKVSLVDIRNAELDSFNGTNLVLNRVYASVANRDFGSINKTLSFLKELERRGVKCLNSYLTSLYDYNKYESYKIMKSNGVLTPETLFINSEEDIERFADEAVEKLSFPLIIKRNTGGRGKDISKLETKKEIILDLKKKFSAAKKEQYFGGFIAQNFIKSSKNHDCRMGLFDGKFLFSYGRTLVPSNSEGCWLASVSNGSTMIDYDSKEDEISAGEKVSQLIGAGFNEIDILLSDRGPVIIENNPTPNYDAEDERDVKLMNEYVNKIINNFK